MIPGTTARIPIAGSQGLFDCALQGPGGAQGPSADRFLLAGLGETPGGGGPLLAAMRRAAPGSPVLESDPEFGSGGFVEPSRPQGNWANVSTDRQNRVVVGGELGLFETADLSAGRYIDVPRPADDRHDGAGHLRRQGHPPLLGGQGWRQGRDTGREQGQAGDELPLHAVRGRPGDDPDRTPQAQRREQKRKKAKFTRVGTFAESGAAGANRNPFSGRIGKKRLRPGRYRATLVATDAAGNASAPRQVAFKVILRPIPRSAGAT